MADDQQQQRRDNTGLMQVLQFINAEGDEEELQQAANQNQNQNNAQNNAQNSTMQQEQDGQES